MCFIIFETPADPAVQARIADSKTRFLQFGFLEDHFFLDLPDTALTAREASRLIAERPGFEYALDGPKPDADDRKFDILKRPYKYDLKRVAAEDAAYILFDLWQTPIDSWIKIYASASQGKRIWEKNFSLGRPDSPPSDDDLDDQDQPAAPPPAVKRPSSAVPKVVSERERRIRQFEHYIGLMVYRALRLAQADCSLTLTIPSAAKIRPQIGDSEIRYVRLVFKQERFRLEVPDTLLTADETQRLLEEQSGFRHTGEILRRTTKGRGYESIRRLYEYSKQREAAEDIASIFFDLWETPLGVWIKVDASTLSKPQRVWEKNFSMA